MSRGGSGVATLDDGRIVFVPYTAPGDQVEITLLETKKNYAQGKLITLIQPSPHRANPPCSVFGKCGGCTWQHIPYDLQLQTKAKGVEHALKRVGVQLEQPLEKLGAKNAYFYRNRIQLRGLPETQALGFYAKDSHQVVSIDQCEIARPEINSIIPLIKKQGLEEFKKPFKVEVEVDPTLTVHTSWNRGHAARGFRQVNDEQNQVLQIWVKNAIVDFLKQIPTPEPTPSSWILYDLFGGDGNLSLGLSQHFKETYCVDLSRNSDSVSFPQHFKKIRADVYPWLQHQPSHPHTSIAILDPPREGLGASAWGIQSELKRLNTQSLLLVSCDPDSFARDTAQLIKQNWKLNRAAIIDLFPQTPHVESLALFTLTHSDLHSS